MRVTFENGKFYCECSFEQRGIPRAAKFSWDDLTENWYTNSYRKALLLGKHFDESAKLEIRKKSVQVIPWKGAIPYPSNEKPKNYQIRSAVPFALSRNHSYLALDPGLGKTICAALILNALDVPALYICPPFLVPDVKDKIGRWKISKENLFVLPDTMLAKCHVKRELALWVRKQVKKPILFIDEAHRFKSLDAIRTDALYEDFVPMFEKIIFLSGTPAPNSRPIELYSAIANCAWNEFDFLSKHEYGLKYCKAFHNGYDWDYSGVSNLKEFSKRVRSKFLLRIKKKDVLKELGDVIIDVVTISPMLPPAISKLERKILRTLSPKDEMKKFLQKGNSELPLSTYRKALGIAKAPLTVPFIENILDSTEGKVLVFAIHKSVISHLNVGLSSYRPFVIIGDTPMLERFKIQKKFQTDKTRRLIIANIQAGGIGFDFTKASTVIFVEYSWVPGENQQAIDRAHRIGQENQVMVYYLSYRNSLDRTILETNLTKNQNAKFL